MRGEHESGATARRKKNEKRLTEKEQKRSSYVLYIQKTHKRKRQKKTEKKRIANNWKRSLGRNRFAWETQTKIQMGKKTKKVEKITKE